MVASVTFLSLALPVFLHTHYLLVTNPTQVFTYMSMAFLPFFFFSPLACLFSLFLALAPGLTFATALAPALSFAVS